MWRLKRLPAAFLEGVAAAGVRAVFALPLRIGDVSVGAPTSTVPARETDDRPALRGPDGRGTPPRSRRCSRHGDANPFADDPDGRTTYQMQVHQASGMVKIQAVMIDEAFPVLRAHAFATGLAADVANDVIERRLRFPAEDRMSQPDAPVGPIGP